MAKLEFALERTGMLLVFSVRCRGADPKSDVSAPWGSWDLDFITVRVASCGMRKACVLEMMTKRERTSAKDNLIVNEQSFHEKGFRSFVCTYDGFLQSIHVES
jgi:hypothetical protein